MEEKTPREFSQREIDDYIDNGAYIVLDCHMSVYKCIQYLKNKKNGVEAPIEDFIIDIISDYIKANLTAAEYMEHIDPVINRKRKE